MEDLKFLCFNEELNLTQIILYDIYRRKEQVPYLIVALYNLGFYNKIYKLIEENEEVLEYFEIQRLLSNIKDNKKPNIILKGCRKYIERRGDIFLKESSLHFLYRGKIEQNRQEEYFLRSFYEDNNNIEALIFLMHYCDYTEERIINLIDEQNEDLRNFIRKIFQSVSNGSISFVLSNMFSLHLYRNSRYIELYNHATYLIDQFPESEVGYIAMGRYFLSNENYKKAKVFYERAIRINKNSKAALLGAGISFTFLYETKKALEFYERADRLFSSCFKCKFLLIYELMKNPRSGRINAYLKKLGNVFIDKEFISYYCLLVFKLNRYELASDRLSNENENLVPRIFFHIFNENYYTAEILVKKLEKNWIFFLISGYILVLKGNFDHAKAFLIESDNHISKKSHIIEELLKSAQNKYSPKDKNGYTTKIYEFILFNTLSFFKI